MAHCASAAPERNDGFSLKPRQSFLLPSIRGGDKISLECTYNNSPTNRNVAKAMDEVPVSKPFDLHLGETTQDEMCLAALVIVRPYVSLVDAK